MQRNSIILLILLLIGCGFNSVDSDPIMVEITCEEWRRENIYQTRTYMIEVRDSLYIFGCLPPRMCECTDERVQQKE